MALRGLEVSGSEKCYKILSCFSGETTIQKPPEISWEDAIQQPSFFSGGGWGGGVGNQHGTSGLSGCIGMMSHTFFSAETVLWLLRFAPLEQHQALAAQ